MPAESRFFDWNVSACALVRIDWACGFFQIVTSP